MQMATKQTGYQHVTGSDRWVRTAVWMQLMGVDSKTIKRAVKTRKDIDEIARLNFQEFLVLFHLKYDDYKDSELEQDFKTKLWIKKFQSNELEIREDDEEIVDEWDRYVRGMITNDHSWDNITWWWYNHIRYTNKTGIPTTYGKRAIFFRKTILKAKICDRNSPRNRHHIPVSTLETNCPKCGKEKQKT